MVNQALKFFYDYPAIKEQFKNDKQVNKEQEDWIDNWLDDSKLVFATAYLEQYRKDNGGYISSKQHAKKCDKLRIEGVPDKEMIAMYFNRTFFDIKAAPLHGVAACEIMAEFALFETIRMSKKLDCEIHYIRFLGLPQRCETMNFIALGNWPDKGCLLISPWLGEKGDTVIWQGSLKATGKHAKINFPD